MKYLSINQDFQVLCRFVGVKKGVRPATKVIERSSYRLTLFDKKTSPTHSPLKLNNGLKGQTQRRKPVL